MPSKKVKSEHTEVIGGGSTNKKIKLATMDPFEGKYGDVVVEIYNHNMPLICEKLKYADPTLIFEVKNYRFEISGVSKTVCGETRFVEESKAVLTITYEISLKEQIIKFLQDQFPTFTYSFK